MPDLDPEIWNNETLGAAAPNVNLDVVERQEIENRAAKFEDREPREIVNDNTYPGWTPEVNERTGTVSSNYQTVHFTDENPNDIPVDSGRPEEDAGTVSESEETPDGTPEENSEGPEEGSEDSDVDSNDVNDVPAQDPTVPADDESTSTESNSTEENGTTQWT